MQIADSFIQLGFIEFVKQNIVGQPQKNSPKY